MTTHSLTGNPVVTDPAERRSRLRRTLPDYLAIVVLLAAFPVVHDVKRMLTAPYWLDEAWVAMSVRFPLSDVPAVTGPTPVGWTFLLRLVPDANYLRLVPLAFHLLTIVAAYLLARGLGWPTTAVSRIASFTCGSAVLLLPVQQVRHDLKQYTADAAVALALLAVAAWAEGGWSRKRLGVLVAVVPLGMLVSHTTAVVAGCVFGGLVLAAAARRQWPRLAEAAVAGLAAGVIIMVIYLLVSRQGDNANVQDFWAPFMPSPAQLPRYLIDHVRFLMAFMAMPTALFGGLLLCGVVTIARLGRPGVAAVVVLLPLAAVVLGVARIYPLLDVRTSHFLLVAAAAVAGIGLAGLTSVLAGWVRRLLPVVPRPAGAAVICAVVLAAFVVTHTEWYPFKGETPIDMEDVRSATRYVAAHRSPQDVILVSPKGRYGFVFYWNKGPVTRVPYDNGVTWHVALPTQPEIIFAGDDEASIQRALDQALDLADKRGPGARVWLVRSHVIADEIGSWQHVLAGHRVTLVTGGVEPLATVAR